MLPHDLTQSFPLFSLCSNFMLLSLICRVSISTPYYFLRLNLNLKNNWLFAANVIPNLSISLNFPNVGYDCFLSKPKSLSSWTFFISLRSWQLLLVSRFSGSVGSGSFPGGDANCTMNLDSEDFVKMFKGELNPTQAFMGGKLKIKGDMMLAMKLEKLMGKMKSKL